MWTCISSAACLFLGMASLAGSGRAEALDEAVRKLPSRFEGRFVWQQPGTEVQNVVLQLASRSIDPQGNIIALGKEFYSIGARFWEIDVKVVVNPRTLRFELTEQPGVYDFAHDSSIGQPIVGSISPDLSMVQRNLADGDSGVFPDFVLWAADPPRQIAGKAR